MDEVLAGHTRAEARRRRQPGVPNQVLPFGKKGFKKSTDRATAAAARCIGLQTIWSIQVLQHECWASSLAWPLLGLYLVRDILRLFFIYFLKIFFYKNIFLVLDFTVLYPYPPYRAVGTYM